MIRLYATGLSILTLLIGASQSFAAGNPAQGQRAFGACAACHTLRPDENMTGPSLAGLWNRKAGTLASFSRYSPAMKSADIEWNDKTLDEWIDDPQHLVPGNEMTFAGIKDARQRADPRNRELRRNEADLWVAWLEWTVRWVVDTLLISKSSMPR